MINRTVLQGRLCADPELRYTNTGVSVCSFRLAWSEKMKEAENKLFIGCVAWRSTAELLSKWFRKGQEVIVEGKIETRDWKDKGGNPRSSIELTVEHVHFCGQVNSKKAEETAQWESVQYQKLSDSDDGNLPF